MTPSILVIRGGAIGDFVLTLPAIRLLREAFPQARLEILGYQHIVALADGRYYAHGTRSIEYGGLSRFFIPGAELPDELQEWFAGFQQVVSYLCDPDRYFEGNLRRAGVKHYLHGPPVIGDGAHASHQLAKPLEQLALYLDEPAPVLYPAEDDRRAAEAFLARAFPGGDGPLVALHPGSGGGARKNWPAARWAELGERLFGMAPEARLLLIGGEADQAELDHLRGAWPGRRVAEARSLPLPELAAVLGRARVYLGHDSGVSHIAAAAGAGACVLLFGPTDPEVWAPLNAGVRVVRAPDGRMERLEAEPVAEALEQALGD